MIALGGLTTAALAFVPDPYAVLVAISVAADMVRTSTSRNWYGSK
ncbi:hypothetical protein [Streptomyces sp. NPDC048825]